jgi:hypothetical protein
MLHILFLSLLVTAGANIANAQASLAPDQNPSYSVSRDKYIKMADSINAWHSTTVQQTYRAIDYLEDRRIAREERRAFRRELRLERTRHGGGRSYYDNAYYNPYYLNGYNNYGYLPYYGYRHRDWNNIAWDVLPWAITAALWCR